MSFIIFILKFILPLIKPIASIFASLIFGSSLGPALISFVYGGFGLLGLT